MSHAELRSHIISLAMANADRKTLAIVYLADTIDKLGVEDIGPALQAINTEVGALAIALGEAE